MKLPSKVTAYKDSVLAKIPLVLQKLQSGDMHVLELYKQTKKQYSCISEYFDVLDCLYALNKIEYFEQERVLHYVS